MVLRISACEGIHPGQRDASPWQLVAGAVEAGVVEGAAIARESGSRDPAMVSSNRVEMDMCIFDQLRSSS